MTPLAFTVLDLRALRPYSRSLLLSLVVASVAVVVPSRSVYGLLPAVFFLAAAIGPQYPFSLDERSRLDTLYATLPLPRRTVVLGRYVTMLTVALALAAVGLLVAVAAAPAFGERLDPTILGQLATGGFAAFCFFTALQLPFFFALGFTRARPFAFVAPLVGIAVAMPWLGGNADAARVLERLASWPVLAGAAAAGVVLLGVSAAISARLYARRDL